MKKIPEFENEDEEREFWATANSPEYVDWESAKLERFEPFPTVNPDADLDA
jgi:CopG antitoxin of type II toxin-antitoxin system